MFVNPDKTAAWPRERLWAQEAPDAASLDAFCTGQRQSRDVIVFLGQKKHSSYDATHANTLRTAPCSTAASRAAGATAGRGTRSGPTRTSTSARPGIGTRRRVSGRTGRRRTSGCGAATSRSTSTARSGRRTTSRRRMTRRKRIASGRRISSRRSAGRGAGRLSSDDCSPRARRAGPKFGQKYPRSHLSEA